MQPVTRRSIMVGSAAAMTAIPAVGLCKGSAEHVSSDLTDLIDKHRAAYKIFSDAIDRCSPLEEMERKTGRVKRALARAEREVDQAGDVEINLFYDLCGHRCQSLEEARIKAEYLLTTYLVRDTWDQEATELLRSFV